MLPSFKGTNYLVVVGLLGILYVPKNLPAQLNNRAEVQNGVQASSTRDSALQAILDKAAVYAAGYRKLCRELVAEERMTQKEYDKKGRLKRERRFLSDYLFVTLPSDPDSTVEFRDVISIDGKTMSRRKRGLLELFEKKSSNAFKEAEQITRESTKHNLGRKRYTNMVNFGLNFVLAEFQDGIEYRLLDFAHLPEGQSVILEFREITGETALRAVTPYGKRPIPSKGRIWLSLPDFKILKIDFTFEHEDELNPLVGRYVSEYKLGPDSLLLPSRFEEYFYDPAKSERILFESIAVYSNFRRFSAEVKILPDDSLIKIEK